MRTLSGLMTGGWSRRRGTTVALVVVAVLVPLALLVTLVPQRAEQRIHAAVVNLDVPLTDTATPVAVGKLLTENLVTTATDFDWTLTDPGAAAAGLANGTYLAVLTIPADFSKTTTTLASSAPERATIGVQTSAAHGYLAGSVATALSRSLPAGVAAQLTSGYVSGTLQAFGKLGQGIGQASQGASTIAGGTEQAASGASAIGAATGELSSGLGDMSRVLGALPSGARDLGRLTAAGAASSGDLALRLLGESATSGLLADAQSLQVDALDRLARDIEADPSIPASEIVRRLDEIRSGAKDVAATLATQRDALGKDAVDAGAIAVGAGVIAVVSEPVAEGLGTLADAAGQASSGAAALADANVQLAGGLDQLAAGGSQLAGGLESVEQSIPQYSAAQQQDIASVVATPVGVDATSVAGPDTAWAASLAALAPIALWLGALVLFLFVAPFSRAALATSASVGRIARSASGVVVLVALGQAVPLAILLAVSGAAGERVLVACGFVAGVSIVFGLLHQGLVALLGRVGLVVSLVALGVQTVAAGTLVPHAASADGPLSLLPLSIALQGMQSVFGGSLHGVLSAAIGLTVWAVAAVAMTLIGISRARRRSLAAGIALAV